MTSLHKYILFKYQQCLGIQLSLMKKQQQMKSDKTENYKIKLTYDFKVK